MEVPFYLPTSFGPLTVGATLAPDVAVSGPPVVLLPGGKHPRGRDRVHLAVARSLAAEGRPVFRIDYPGFGLSPTSPLERDRSRELLLEAIRWIRNMCEAEEAVVGGTCGGGSQGIALAAMDPTIRTVIAVDCPLTSRGRRPQTKPTRRLKAGLAGIDPVGTRVGSLLVGKKRNNPTDQPWAPRLVGDLTAAVAHARVGFVYGADDVFYADFQRLISSGDLEEHVVEALHLKVRPDTALYGFRDPVALEWVGREMTNFVLDHSSEVRSG